jgi:hypothetical protein
VLAAQRLEPLGQELNVLRPRPMVAGSACPQAAMRSAGDGVQDRIGPASA